ncbi:MAG TPA: copper resistance protein CopC [Solirubrobacterales bacterium]|nr:copper resistance protein CopC [Solirubrobacterales bacterium]
MIRSRLRYLLPLCAALLACLILPGSALAHAVLESSSPTRGAVLKQPPRQVTFEFNEPVEASLGAVRVFNAEAEEVQSGEIRRLGDSGTEIAIGLQDDLPDGVYTATYRVVSADAHPVSGGMVFTVGSGGTSSGKTISELIAMSDVGPVTEVAFWFDRWAGYVAIAIAVGLLSFLLLLWTPLLRARDGLLAPRAEEFGDRLRKILGAAVLTGLIASLLAIPLQGATAAGTDFWSSLKPEVFREVIDTRYGTVMVIRVLAWLALVPAVLASAGLARNPGWSRKPLPLAAIAVPAIVLVVTPALAGHASTQHPIWLLTASDILHVAAMSVWVGGLAALVLLLPSVTRRIAGTAERNSVLVDFLLRFSTVALVAVIVIAVSGSIQAIVEVNSFPALVDTAFGRAVLIKIILFAALIAFGASNRRRIIPALVARRERGEGPGETGLRARRNLRLEVVLVMAVLALTAALVSYPPPTASQSGPVSGSVAAGPDRLEYTVDPAWVGSNEIHVYLFDDRTGAPMEVKSLELSFSLPDSDIAPIEADVRKAGPGHYVAPAAMLAVKGDWEARAAVRFSRFNEVLADFEVPVE